MAAQVFNIHQAKTHLSRLIEEAIEGKETVIAKAGKPVAKLVPIHRAHPKRKFGVLKGKMRIAEDFDAPLPDDVIKSFEGA